MWDTIILILMIVGAIAVFVFCLYLRGVDDEIESDFTEKVKEITVGMSVDEVLEILEVPDNIQNDGEYVTYSWTLNSEHNKIGISQFCFVTFKNDKVFMINYDK